jgi:hypothetical protein
MECGAGGKSDERNFSGMVGHQRDPFDPFGAHLNGRSPATLIGPSTGWPPVMATASL